MRPAELSTTLSTATPSRALLSNSVRSDPTDASAAVVDFAAVRRAAGGASRAVGVVLGIDGIRATKTHRDVKLTLFLDPPAIQSQKIGLGAKRSVLHK